MTLRAYLRVLRERWRLVVVFVLVATGVALLITNLTPKTYSATAQVLVSTSSAGDASVLNQANAFVTVQVPTFAQTIDNPDILKYIQSDLHLGLDPATLKSKISAQAVTGEAIIDVIATDGNAARAANIANSAARGFIQAVEGFNSSVKLFLTGPADEPASATSPKPVLNIALGVLLGLLLGAALAVARDVLDNRIKDAETLSKVADAAIMGVVVDDPKTKRHPVATRAGNRNIRAENFRQLRANLQFANVDEHPRVIAVTSSIPEEGKTTVAINLASTLAEAGFSVCLVDADLRRPTVAKVLGLVSPVGLTSVLIQQISLQKALQHAGSSLYVLASGPTPPNPSEVLASSYVRDVIRSLLDQVDYVVIDTAPLLPVADGSEVAALADGTLLVARHGVTTDTNVERAAQTLRRVDAKLLGVVLNRAPMKRNNEYGYTYYQTDDLPHSKPNNTVESSRRGRRAARSADESNREGSRA
ncbi:MAG: polysaccharide biosynthesis tyrosine autokinase [Jatrophihabitans sp.]|uniref:polysaccharide biosynthesis tyrosine autokinase n=1 Tax=Jatrophihabitans sp. TaxID=1932789 RepID=UPI0039101A46